MKGSLFLLPTVLSDDTHLTVIPASVKDAIRSIRYFLCENVRTSRRYVSNLKVHDSIESLTFEVLNKDTEQKELARLLHPAQEGNDIGLMSEAGCPGVADPGALAVEYAHQKGIRVIPMVGPSSILLALMASGMNGQRFVFHGYLPIDSKESSDAITKLERESKEKNQTQIFIETPYRSKNLMTNLVKTLRSDTRLCVALNLTGSTEKIISRPVGQWKKNPVTIDKEPAVFLFLAASERLL
jgi:16S rRNA (cytidine1402-2'-O)-methyltransferase